MAAQRIASLDGLRGIAILEVLIWHFLAAPASHSKGLLSTLFFDLTQFSSSGVQLFFVLSGFLIGRILLSSKDSDRYFSTFYIRRACRILPLYVLIVGFMALWTFADPTGSAIIERPMPWIVYATFTQNFWLAHRNWEAWNVFLAVTWSLAVEQQFYLILPTFIRITPRRYLAKCVIGIVVATPILRTVLFLAHHLQGPSSYVMLFCRTDALMLGVLGAMLVGNEQWMRRIREHQWMLRSALLASATPLIVLAAMHSGVGGGPMTTFGYSCFAAFYFLVLMEAACFENGLLARVCRNRFLKKTGVLAYGLFLFHMPIYEIVEHLGHLSPPVYPSAGYFQVVATATALTFFCSWLSWTNFESRFMDLGHRFGYRKSATATAKIPMAKPPAAVGEAA